jgi:hypothetical protein
MQTELDVIWAQREPELDELRRARTGEEDSRAELLEVVRVVHDERRSMAGKLEELKEQNCRLVAHNTQLQVKYRCDSLA